jgi:nitrate reductase beta subunit
VTLGQGRDADLAAAVGMTPEALEQLYRLLANAKYSDRYVIPTAHREEAHNLEELACSLDYDGGPGMYASGPFGEASGRPVPVAIETYSALKARQQAEEAASADLLSHRAGLLNWDGNEDVTP